MYQKIKALCAEKKISVCSLEKELGLSTGNVSKWNKSMPRADTLLKVASYLEVSIDYLLSEKILNVNEKILNGEISINQARIELGLLPISDELANEKLTEGLFYNNKRGQVIEK